MPPMGLGRRCSLEIREVLRRWSVRRSTAVLVLSNKTKREVELLFGHDRVIAVPTGGFSRTELRLNSVRGRREPGGSGREPANLGRSAFLSVSRLVRKKRVDFLLEAYAVYVKDHGHSTSEFVVGGAGPELEPLKELAGRLGVSSSVAFTGFIPEEKLWEYFADCDAFLQADIADFDLTTMMAMSFMKSVVVTQQFDFPDCLEQARALTFVARDDPADFARQMAAAARPRPSIDRQATLAELGELTWERYFRRILELGIGAQG
jgi:glycosyltransferase involved in cell wall biosynthesis